MSPLFSHLLDSFWDFQLRHKLFHSAIFIFRFFALSIFFPTCPIGHCIVLFKPLQAPKLRVGPILYGTHPSLCPSFPSLTSVALPSLFRRTWEIGKINSLLMTLRNNIEINRDCVFHFDLSTSFRTNIIYFVHKIWPLRNSWIIYLFVYDVDQCTVDTPVLNIRSDVLPWTLCLVFLFIFNRFSLRCRQLFTSRDRMLKRIH